VGQRKRKKARGDTVGGAGKEPDLGARAVPEAALGAPREAQRVESKGSSRKWATSVSTVGGSRRSKRLSLGSETEGEPSLLTESSEEPDVLTQYCEEPAVLTQCDEELSLLTQDRKRPRVSAQGSAGQQSRGVRSKSHRGTSCAQFEGPGPLTKGGHLGRV